MFWVDLALFWQSARLALRASFPTADSTTQHSKQVFSANGRELLLHRSLYYKAPTSCWIGGWQPEKPANTMAGGSCAPFFLPQKVPWTWREEIHRVPAVIIQQVTGWQAVFILKSTIGCYHFNTTAATYGWLKVISYVVSSLYEMKPESWDVAEQSCQRGLGDVYTGIRCKWGKNSWVTESYHQHDAGI